MPTAPPPAHVLRAFGAAGGKPTRLPGGRGTSWLAGSLVLKPADRDPAEAEWEADLFATIVCDGFRLAPPARAVDGALLVDGWCATEAQAGQHRERAWPEIIAVGDKFHVSIAGCPRPGFIDRRSDRWAVADRVAWGELPASRFGAVPHVQALAAACRPIAAQAQLIHGDLTGNVLFHPGQPPAIIDFAPYWRPAAFASAIVVADALVFEGAGPQVLDAVSHIRGFGQFLVRALIFRLVTEWLFRQEERPEQAPPEEKPPDLRAEPTGCQEDAQTMATDLRAATVDLAVRLGTADPRR